VQEGPAVREMHAWDRAWSVQERDADTKKNWRKEVTDPFAQGTA
jgi:hypothetical protein